MNNIYKGMFIDSANSRYYCDDELLFRVVRRDFYYFFGAICTIYIDDIPVLKFYYYNFMGLIYRIKILDQNLNKKLKLIKRGFKYKLIIGEKILLLKLTSNPFVKIIGEIFIDGKSNCKIRMDEVSINTDVNFNFVENSELHFYSLILFVIMSVGITEY